MSVDLNHKTKSQDQPSATTGSSAPDKTATRSAKHGKSFPVVPLLEAANTLANAGKYGPEHGLAAFAGYLGHSTTNSGPFRTKLAAFKDWKLVTQTGDKITMTSLGKRIAMSEDPSMEIDALREAFMGCKIFASIYDSSAKGQLLDLQQIGKNAVLNLGVAAGSREKFVLSLSQSAAAAGLAELTEDQKKLRFLAEEIGSPGPKVNSQPASESGHEQTRTVRVPEHKDLPAATTVLRQVWPTRHGEVVFEVKSRQPLSADAFSLLGAVVESAKSLADSLGLPDDAPK
jgi:hypothetical protein